MPECASRIGAQVPGDVHQDLINAGLLPEPLVGANAPLHEWVEGAVFTYERDLAIDSDFDRAELVFHGIDCLAEVYVGSDMVGSSADAFVEHVFDITPFVKPGGTYQLKVVLDTGVQWAKTQDSSLYQNGTENPERAFLRKSQFSFKWDWAPRLVTCGLWRDVELKLYKDAAIRDAVLTPTFEGESSKLEAKIAIEAFAPGDYLARLRVVRGPLVWQSTQSLTLAGGVTESAVEVDVTPVERWFPVGYGDQPLYGVSVELERAGETVDGWFTTYGFREVIIRQDPLSEGETSFIINVNGIDVFCKGANWVPADSIVARVTDAKYEALVTEAVAANFNMFRIWGGGIYEDKTFYDLCDRHGVMIWHDFMFACAEYPDDQPWFVDNVRDEAVKVVRSLRNHPCIAIWCGNNENDWGHGFYTRGQGKGLAEFYGQKIYHDVLPQVCAELDPKRPYWPSSPFGGNDPNCEQCGDRHAWNVSIQDSDLTARADIRNYRKDRGKFNSEYGVISYASERTILDYTLDGRVNLTSEAYKLHDNPFNAHVTETESLTDWYLKVGFGSVPDDPTTYIHQSLAYQAMGYREAISDFRIRKFDCAGSLFWMYSDCWGTLGWTIIDYYLRRKPSFYWVKKAYAPLAVFVRAEGDLARSYVVNDTLSEVRVDLTMEVGDMSGVGQSLGADLTVPANGVATGPELPCGPGYAFARIQVDGAAVSDDLVLTRFPSEMEVPPVSVTCDARQDGDQVIVAVSSEGFGHFAYLDLPDGAIPTDNYFNVLPNRPRIIRVKGARPDQISVGALNLR